MDNVIDFWSNESQSPFVKGNTFQKALFVRVFAVCLC